MHRPCTKVCLCLGCKQSLQFQMVKNNDLETEMFAIPRASKYLL